jgi:transcriptional regulator with XRE-family HTH domain
MAANKNPICTVDNLPEALRRQVVDALLAGESLRTVAKLAGCSHLAISDYKKRIVVPAIEKAQRIQNLHQPELSGFPQASSQTALTRDIIRTDPFRERLEALWSRTNEALDASAPGTQYFNLFANILNQAHKNLELLGRVTGDLADDKAPSVAIQIVLPSVSHDSPVIDIDPAIEIALPTRK